LGGSLVLGLRLGKGVVEGFRLLVVSDGGRSPSGIAAKS
jgi:hypothetical protein